MPVEDAAFLAVVVMAFAVFAGVLAWATARTNAAGFAPKARRRPF